MPVSSLPLRRALVAALAFLALVTSTGCSAARMALHLTGVRGGETFTTSRGEGPREERLTVFLEDAPPLPEPPQPELPPEEPPPEEPPVVVSPPVVVAPPVVVEPPVDVPLPPADPPPLAFRCERQDRFQHEVVSHSVREFSFIEKIVLGFPLLFDTVSAIAIWSEVLDDPHLRDDDTVPLMVMGSVFSADALGLLAIILFMPPVDTTTETRVPGKFRAGAPCAPPDVVERDGRRMVLDERGWMTVADEAFLVRELAFEGGGVDVIAGTQRSTATPSHAQVCRWAADRGLAALRCQVSASWLGTSAEPAVITLPVD